MDRAQFPELQENNKAEVFSESQKLIGTESYLRGTENIFNTFHNELPRQAIIPPNTSSMASLDQSQVLEVPYAQFL